MKVIECTETMLLYTIKVSIFKGVVEIRFFVAVKYLKYSLGTRKHIKGTCISDFFKSNGPLVFELIVHLKWVG